MKCKILAMVLLALVMVSNTVASTANAADLAQISAELIQMRREDQAVRSLPMSPSDTEKIQRMWAVDAKNLKRLKEIIKLIGWPTKRLVGEEASSSAFLIAQHAATDIPFMEEALTYIEAEFNAKQAPGSQFALLYDRVQILHGKPQKYGTQFSRTKEACVPLTLIQPEQVNEFRAQLGLGTLAEYTARVCK